MNRNVRAKPPTTGRLLITGFDAFGKLRENPSAVLVRRLAEHYGDTLDTAILPTSYEHVGERLNLLMSSLQPSALLMFGYSSRSPGLRLEHYAHNLDRSRTPDVDGAMHTGKLILPEAAQRYETTAPLTKLVADLKQRGFPVTASRDAGGYVCNHAYFLALHQSKEHGVPALCLFVHVPRWRGAEVEQGVWVGARVLADSLLAEVASIPASGTP